jgi:hypothetical protein
MLLEQTVVIEVTRCTYGGKRYWSRCPTCNRRTSTSFVVGPPFGCRVSMRLACESRRDPSWTTRRSPCAFSAAQSPMSAFPVQVPGGAIRVLTTPVPILLMLLVVRASRVRRNCDPGATGYSFREGGTADERRMRIQPSRIDPSCSCSMPEIMRPARTLN